MGRRSFRSNTTNSQTLDRTRTASKHHIEHHHITTHLSSWVRCFSTLSTVYGADQEGCQVASLLSFRDSDEYSRHDMEDRLTTDTNGERTNGEQRKSQAPKHTGGIADSTATVRTGNLSPKLQASTTSPFSDDEVNEIPTHNRQVSWDSKLIADPLPNDYSPLPAGIFQPALEGAIRLPMQEIPESATVDASNLPRSRTGSASQADSYIRLELADITHHTPYEAEAETYILKALEQRDPTLPHTRTRSDTVTSSVLGHIPEDVPHDFCNPGDNESGEVEQTRYGSEAPSEMSSNENPHSQRSSSEHPHSPRSRHAKHRRTNTVEETLFGLTLAMNDIHTLEDTPQNGAVAWEPSSRHGAGNSAEQLAAKASLLYRKKNDDHAPDDVMSDVGSVDHHSVGSSSTSRRATLRHAVNVVGIHKTDSDTLNAASMEEVPEEDEERGNSESQERVEGRGTVKDAGGSSKKPRFSVVANRKEVGYVSKFQDFMSPVSSSIYQYCKMVLLCLVFPSTGIAAILFHLADNPPTGYTDGEGATAHGSRASVSWWLMFLGVRQVVTFSLALLTQLIVIDFLSIRVGGTHRLFGPWITLTLVQSRGWPFSLFMWGVYDFCLLYGDGPFYDHWFFWQSTFEMLTDKNPAGNVIYSDANRRILSVAVCVGAVVAIKRFWLALFLGKQTFNQYAEKLAGVMKKILLVTKVASLSRDFERSRIQKNKSGYFGIGSHVLENIVRDTEADDESQTTHSNQPGPSSTGFLQVGDYVINPDDRDPLTGSLSASQKMRIVQTLGRWEEPEIADTRDQPISVRALLQFRRALTSINTPFPFSGAFGLADTRENTIESSQEVYQRLRLGTPDDSLLQFETIAAIAVGRDGILDENKLKYLIRIFRPRRDGSLSMVDFIKSVDSVYKSLRLLRASVANSSKIDRAFENIFNIAFYAIVACVILSQLGFDPLALFLSVSGVILAFAFMIGNASSKYFDGLLFILVRRPFSIGDGIHVSNVESETSSDGSPPWIVEDVTLFSTTCVNMWTNEKATLSNGSLANSRIINAARSPQAFLYVYLKFGVDVPHSKLEIFRSALEQFIKDRPREWLSLCGFRATRVESQLNFVEYIVVLQHRECWQAITPLYMSRAAVSSFCLELSKKLAMHYKSPPLPVDLSINQRHPATAAASPLEGLHSSPPDVHPDLSSVAAMFGQKK